MSAWWQVGERAVCVVGGTHTVPEQIYTVIAVQKPGEFDGVSINIFDYSLLRFAGVPHGRAGWSDCRRFRKIKPDTEPCEEEFVTLLKRSAPVNARAAVAARGGEA